MKSSLGNQWMFRFQPQVSPMSGSDYLIICITGCVWTYGKPKKVVLMEKTDYILSGTLFSGSEVHINNHPQSNQPPQSNGLLTPINQDGWPPPIKKNLKKHIYFRVVGNEGHAI